jgi:basic amino acid/polyamine antiporter, APA family
VCIGVLVLRYTRPELHRPFRVKAIWPVSMLGIFFCGMMAIGLPGGTWVRLLVRTAVGVLLYFAYGYRNSVLRKG